MSPLPTGTVTFLFTDIERFEHFIQKLGDRKAQVLAEYRRLLRVAAYNGGGHEIRAERDRILFAFPHARRAVVAAIKAITRLLSITRLLTLTPREGPHAPRDRARERRRASRR